MQAPLIYLLSRYCDGTATGQNAIGDAVIFEFIHDGGRIFRRQVGEERAKLWRTRPQKEGGKARQRREDAADQHPLLRGGQPGIESLQLCGQLSHRSLSYCSPALTMALLRYSRSLLRSVRRLMPRILAAWVRLPFVACNVSMMRARSISRTDIVGLPTMAGGSAAAPSFRKR